MMKFCYTPNAVLLTLSVLLGGCVGDSSDNTGIDATPAPVILTRQSVLGNRRPPGEMRPGVHFVDAKQPYIIIVLVKGNLNTPEEKRTPRGAVCYELEARQDGERDKDDNLVTPAMGITVTLRLHTPKGVPVLVRRWLAPNDPKLGQDSFPGSVLFKTKRDVYEDLWLQGGDVVLSWRLGP